MCMNNAVFAHDSIKPDGTETACMAECFNKEWECDALLSKSRGFEFFSRKCFEGCHRWLTHQTEPEIISQSLVGECSRQCKLNYNDCFQEAGATVESCVTRFSVC